MSHKLIHTVVMHAFCKNVKSYISKENSIKCQHTASLNLAHFKNLSGTSNQHKILASNLNDICLIYIHKNTKKTSHWTQWQTAAITEFCHKSTKLSQVSALFSHEQNGGTNIFTAVSAAHLTARYIRFLVWRTCWYSNGTSTRDINIALHKSATTFTQWYSCWTVIAHTLCNCPT